MLLTFTSKQNFSKYLLPYKIVQEDGAVSSYVPQTVTECTILMCAQAGHALSQVYSPETGRANGNTVYRTQNYHLNHCISWGLRYDNLILHNILLYH
jgi:hypothetical protein